MATVLEVTTAVFYQCTVVQPYTLSCYTLSRYTLSHHTLYLLYLILAILSYCVLSRLDHIQSAIYSLHDHLLSSLLAIHVSCYSGQYRYLLLLLSFSIVT